MTVILNEAMSISVCFYFFFFFLPAIANSNEIAETSLGMGVVKENPEALEREEK